MLVGLQYLLLRLLGMPKNEPILRVPRQSNPSTATGGQGLPLWTCVLTKVYAQADGSKQGSDHPGHLPVGVAAGDHAVEWGARREPRVRLTAPRCRNTRN